MATKKENLRPEAATLSYSDACLGDEGTRELCSQLLDHRMLTSLDLRGCQIHAAGTAAITQLLLHTSAPPINTISLEWNNLGTSDAGPKSLATAIAKSRTLTSLDLRNNHLGPSAVAAIADGIAHATALRSIDLRWNSAGASGGHALEEALSANHSVLRCQLSGNRVPADCLQRLEALLSRNGGHAASHAEMMGNDPIARAPGARMPLSASSSGRSLQQGGAAHSDVAGGGLTAVVRTRTLESAMALQQADFSTKIEMASGRVNQAEGAAAEAACASNEGSNLPAHREHWIERDGRRRLTRAFACARAARASRWQRCR